MPALQATLRANCLHLVGTDLNKPSGSRILFPKVKIIMKLVYCINLKPLMKASGPFLNLIP